MKAARYAAVGVAVVALAAGALLWSRAGIAPPSADATAGRGTAAKNEFVGRPAVASPEDRQVIALGRLEPVSRVIRIAGPSGTEAGRIATLQVAEGDRVVRGQVLAVLDTEPGLAATLAQATATAAMKKVQLAQRKIELENTEKSLTASLEQQGAERDRAQWEVERVSHLQKAGVYSDPALIDKRLALLSANRRLETSRLAVERSQARDEVGVRLDEAIMQAEIRAADAAADKARADHALSSIRAPIDGRILRLIGRLGQQISSSESFAEMGDTDIMAVRTEVFEADVRAIAVGQLAVATSRSLESPLQGTVSRIGLAVGTQSIIREDPAAVLDARVVEVFVRLDKESSARVAGLTNLQVRVAISRINDRTFEQTSRAD